MSQLPKIAYIARAEKLVNGSELGPVSASLDEADALRRDGLWPGGRPSRLYRIEALGEVSAIDGGVHSESWRVVEQLEARAPLEAVSQAFVDFESEMYEEMALWRRAFDRPKDDVKLVETHLEQAIRARGLKHWELRKMPERQLRSTKLHGQSMYSWSSMSAVLAWEAWEIESADEVYDVARRDGWRLWYQSTEWGEFSLEEPPSFDDVPLECWDAWVALSVFYTGSAGFIDVVPETYTVGLRTAYLYGLALVQPVDRGVLGWAMR